MDTDTTTGSVTFVPSIHNSPEHVRRTEETIREVDPDVVAIELGDERYDRLNDDSDSATFEELLASDPSFGEVAQTVLAKIQEKVTQFQGLDPSDTEMTAAVRTADVLDTPVALIDRPMSETFDRLKNEINWTDLVGMVGGPTPSQLERLGELGTTERPDLSDFKNVTDGDDVEQFNKFMKTLSPSLHDAMIASRDEYMAHRIHALRSEGQDVVVVIGAGHHNGIQEELDEVEGTEPTVDVPVREVNRGVQEINLN